MSDRFEIVFLGTGSPLGNPDRCGNGQVVVGGDTHVLVDVGWGAARRLTPSGVRPQLINTALFTHMHTDHMTDVPDFLFQRWTGGATTPLKVYGPDGTQEMIDGFMMALRRDIGFRLAHHGDSLHPDGIKVEVTELPTTTAPRKFLELDGLVFESFEVDHFPVVPAFGYRVTYGDRVVVLSGDTSLCDSLLEASRGADMLVCESINIPMWNERIAAVEKMGMKREAALLGDVPSYHIATDQIAALARDAGVGEIMLTHIIPPISNDPAQVAAFMAGMSGVYAGPIHVAKDTERMPIVKHGS